MDLSTSLNLSARVMSGSWSPFVSPSLGIVASAHLDFVSNQHFWNGARRTTADFATFTGATFGTGDDAGLIGTGIAGDSDILLSWASLNINAPFIMASVFRPKLINGTSQTLMRVQVSATPTTHYTNHTVGTTDRAIHFTSNSTAQASQSSSVLTVDTNYAMATLVQANLFRNSVNGAQAGSEDLAGTLPTYDSVRFLKTNGGTAVLTGRIRHVLFFAQTGGAEISQADLNTLSGELALI